MTNIEDKVIEILNRDPRTKPALMALKEKVIEFNLTDEQHYQAQRILMLSLMQNNKEILNAYWEEFGLPAWKEAHPGENFNIPAM